MSQQQLQTTQQLSHISAWLIFFLGALTAITPLSIDMYLPALPEMPSVFNTSTSYIQLSLSMTIIGISIGQLFGGPISDVLGRKRPLIIGNILCTIATFACAWAPSIEWLLAARFLAGFTGSIGVVIAKAIARDLASGQELVKLLSLLMIVNGLAPVLAPLIGGQVIAFVSWRYIFIILGLFSLLLFIGSFFCAETLSPERRNNHGLASAFGTYKTLLKDRSFMGQCLVQGFGFGAFFAYITGSAFVYQNLFGLSPQEFSYIFGLNSFAIIVASILGGRASNVVSPQSLLAFALGQITLGSIAFLVAISLQAPFLVVTITLLIIASSISNLGASSFSIALKHHAKNAGAASALLGFFSMIFASIMSPLVGINGDHDALPMSIIMVTCSLIAVLAFYTMSYEKE